MNELQQVQSEERDSMTRWAELEPTVKAFAAPYVGDADAQFQAYLATCLSAYRVYMSDYTAPYVTITQSSGFGKSRILQRLAETTAEGNCLVHNGNHYDVTVFYVCARNIKGSTGYPRATSTLRKWLFPDNGCEESQIGNSLLTVFKNGKELDGPIVEELKSVRLELYTVQPEAKKQRTLETSQSQAQSQVSTRVPVLVVAIDEARTLLEIKDSTGVDAFRLLRRALWAVNADERVKNVNGSVFAVLVDTKYLVDEAVPVSIPDPTSRRRGGTAPFPPFILTQTMDVLLNNRSPVGQLPSKSRVLNTNPEQVLEALVSMGRPLWRSMEQGSTLEGKQRELNKFAASKLLFGVDAKAAKSYEDRTLHGVASLLCRVGLRPHASDPMATRLVADFMSVLHYVTYKNDAQITSYTSDPILTFGASYMWYQLDSPALESHILQQFQVILLKGVVDTGNMGQIAARIFLLLAIDATIMGSEVRENAEARKEFVFTGQFCKVPHFVKKLVGAKPEIREDKSAAHLETRNLYSHWLSS
ncbi:hypothetical protein Pcac1_g3132 [Phytophthora cactorum]|nr:hypothetical protein Pcac1_g3132 [Phytophthora cactorum]